MFHVRVVSLTCSNTEIVCALGLADCLVGVDDHSDYPVELVTRLSRVGPDLDIDVDRVRALEPDLVLASLTVPGHERIVAELERAGLRYIAPEPVHVEDVYSDIATIARLLGAPERGDRLVAEMRAVLDHPVERSKTREPISVLVEWWPKPVIVPGRDSWVTDLLESVGGRNPFGSQPVKSAPVSDEVVLSTRPDAIVIAWCGVRPEKYRPDIVYRRPAWQSLEAIRKKRVFCIPEAYLGRPGPRLIEGHKALARVVAACF